MLNLFLMSNISHIPIDDFLFLFKSNFQTFLNLMMFESSDIKNINIKKRNSYLLTPALILLITYSILADNNLNFTEKFDEF